MTLIPLLFVVLVFLGGFTAAGAIMWALASRGKRGSLDWTKRVERLEAEVKRRASEDTRLDLEDEVHRLNEKVEFMEALLADRPKTGALQSGDTDDSGSDRRRD